MFISNFNNGKNDRINTKDDIYKKEPENMYKTTECGPKFAVKIHNTNFYHLNGKILLSTIQFVKTFRYFCRYCIVKLLLKRINRNQFVLLKRINRRHVVTLSETKGEIEGNNRI